MMQRRAIAAGLAGVVALGCIVAVAQVAFGGGWAGGSGEASELLLKSHLAAHEPYSPPSNMYLWWGDTTNHRFAGSGEHIRHTLQMGTIEGGEWRDPMFMGNNGVAAFRSQRFRRISESCCSTIVFPPFEWDFPVYNTHKIIGQRLRNYVANGNMLVLTGGIMEIEFINRYYFFNIEPADGNYSPGPFNMLPDVPAAMKECPRVLPQKGIAVTAVKKESLPSGAQVLWGTPRSSAVFMIKFCEAASPMDGMPPVKVLPRDCPLSEKAGRPCSCGHIIYIGYNFQEPYPTRYDHVLKAAVEILNPSSKEALAKAAAGEKSSPTQSLTMQQAAAAAGSGGDDDESVEQKVAMQKEEIAHLEGSLATLENERKAVHQFTSKDKAPARTSALDQLRDKAAVLIGEIKRAEEGQEGGAGGHGAPSAATGGHGGGVQKLILKSVAALAKDVREVDGKVNRLQRERGGVEERGRGREEGRREGRREERRGHREGERGRDEGRREGRRRQEGGGRAEKEVREQAAKDKAAYQKKLHAVDRELAFEQSVPTPEYVGQAGMRRGGGCGTLCKLKALVQKTRKTIGKELNAAMK